MKTLIITLLSALCPMLPFAQGCLPEGIIFSFHSQIDSFAINYPNCTEIEGDVVIGCGWEGTTDISNLEGLNVLESIGGNLTIGSWSIVFPYYLTSLSGLDNLISIGGWLEISGSQNLTNLMGLQSLTSIGGRLVIWINSNLTTLSGIDHINGGSISELYISENPSLSTCEVASVCSYLADPNGTISIENNAPGCNSQEEVETACGVRVDESAVGGQRSAVICFPNPTTGPTEFQISNFDFQQVSLKIYNTHGQEVATVLDGPWPGGQLVRWDASGLPAGIYFYRTSTIDNRQSTIGKIVKY